MAQQVETLREPEAYLTLVRIDFCPSRSFRWDLVPRSGSVGLSLRSGASLAALAVGLSQVVPAF